LAPLSWNTVSDEGKVEKVHKQGYVNWRKSASWRRLQWSVVKCSLQ